MAAPFGKLGFLYVGTTNISRDLEYYVNVLGAEKLWHYHEFGAQVAALRLCEGPFYLLADHRKAPSILPLFEVPDVRASAKALKARGWKPEGRSFEIPPGPCYVFKDPSGNELGIFENVRPGVMREFAEDPRDA